MAAKRSVFVEWFWRVHLRLYKWSGGRIGASLRGLPVLLLTTTGRKTGQPRTSPLMYLPRGEDFVVIASYLGEPRHPCWWTNLVANPDAAVQIGTRSYRVRAREEEVARELGLAHGVLLLRRHAAVVEEHLPRPGKGLGTPGNPTSARWRRPRWRNCARPTATCSRTAHER